MPGQTTTKQRILASRWANPARRIYEIAIAIAPKILLPRNIRLSRENDRLTLKIARNVLRNNSNFVDAGAHRGELLRKFVKFAPEGRGFAFEPVSDLCDRLRANYPSVQVHSVALGDEESVATFYVLADDSANSSLFQRPEREKGHWLRETQVRVRRLDDCVPEDCHITFMKVDVEDAEFNLFVGAKRILAQDRPTVVFECRSGNLERVANLLNPLGLDVTFLHAFVAGEARQPLDLIDTAKRDGIYYFVASSRI